MTDSSAEFADLFSAITTERLVRFLDLKGWYEHATDRRGVTIFRRDGDRRSELHVLRNADPDVAYEQAADVVSRVSRTLGESLEKVAQEIVYLSSDVLRFRLAGDPDLPGTALVGDVLAFLQDFQRLVRYSARGMEDPTRYFSGATGPHKLTESVVNAWRFGRGEIGSYVPTLFAPVDAVETEEESEEQELTGVQLLPLMTELPEQPKPVVRRVNEYLIGGLAEVGRKIDQDKYEELLDPRLILFRLSRNFCEAAVELLEAVRIPNLEIRIQWSPIGPAPPPTDVIPQTFSITQAHVQGLRRLAKDLKVVREVEPRLFQGWVTRLHRHPDPGQNMLIGKVTVEVQIEGKPKKILISLGRDDYAEACNAHRDGRVVQFEGLLKGTGAGTQIEKVEKFRLVGEQRRLLTTSS